MALGEGMLGPLFAVFAQRIGGNILDITWAWAIYLGMTGILTIVADGVSGDIINGKPPCPAWPIDQTHQRYRKTGAIDPGRNSCTPN